MPDHIYLIGFMGSGKTTVSEALRDIYHLEILEMDVCIEKEEGKKIPEIFAEEGEEYFRKLETRLLRRIREEKQMVVSCGGGTAMRQENVQEMKAHGRIVLLTATPETVYKRVKSSHNRPLLEHNMSVEYIRELMEKRRPAYEAAADFAVRTDGRSAGEIAREIMEAVQ